MGKIIEIHRPGTFNLSIWVKQHGDKYAIMTSNGLIMVSYSFLRASATKWLERLKKWNPSSHIDNYVVNEKELLPGITLDLLWKIIPPSQIEKFMTDFKQEFNPQRKGMTEGEKAFLKLMEEET